MSSTVAAISKADYLKKYLSGNDEKKKEKKKKSKKKEETRVVRMKIVDNDDAFVPVAAPEKRIKGSDEDDDEGDDETNRPQVKLLDCDTEELRMMGKFKSDAFKPLTEMKNEATTSSSSSGRRRRHDSDDDSSPRRRKQSDDEDQSPPRGRRRHDSDSDTSPPRRRAGGDSDESPPRRSRRRDSDDDQSPPRKERPSTQSDTRRATRSSPPRKSRRVEEDDDHSPPRRRPKDDDSSPPRRRPKDDDNSPPRRRLKDNDSSPPRRSRKDDDSSPPRRRPKVEADDDNSPPRRQNRDDDGKMRKTLDGKSAGLQTAEALRREANKLKKKEDEVFSKIGDEVLGKNAKTIVRDKKTGKMKDTAAEEAQKAREKVKQEELKAKYSLWNKGVRQLEERKEKLDEMARVVNEPFARHADDSAMNEHLKQMELKEDPMLAYMQKKKDKKARQTGQVFPRYSGPAPAPNRFGIWPGYRWDGVDRSTGFEAKLFQSTNARQAEQQEFYKWSMGSYE